MLKFNPTRRTRLSRNLRGTSDSASERKVGKEIEPAVPPEKCAVAFGRGISPRPHSVVLSHGDLFCRMCGVIPGDIDDVTEQKVKFHIGYIKEKKIGGKDEMSNLQILCSTCHIGAKNIQSKKPSGIWLLSQVRRAGEDEQRTVFAALRTRFGEEK